MRSGSLDTALSSSKRSMLKSGTVFTGSEPCGAASPPTLSHGVSMESFFCARRALGTRVLTPIASRRGVNGPEGSHRLLITLRFASCVHGQAASGVRGCRCTSVTQSLELDNEPLAFVGEQPVSETLTVRLEQALGLFELAVVEHPGGASEQFDLVGQRRSNLGRLGPRRPGLGPGPSGRCRGAGEHRSDRRLPPLRRRRFRLCLRLLCDGRGRRWRHEMSVVGSWRPCGPIIGGRGPSRQRQPAERGRTEALPPH